MKKSAVRGFVIFAAGAATAVLAQEWYPPEPITAGQFQERANVLIAELAALGAYVAVAQDGRVGIYPNPYACVPPTPPRPNMPKFAVDPGLLRQGVEGAVNVNLGYLLGNESPVYEIERCKPYAMSKKQ